MLGASRPLGPLAKKVLLGRLVSSHWDAFLGSLSGVSGLIAPCVCPTPPCGKTFEPLCLLAYSAKQDFLFLTAVPDVGRSPGETHFPEELKVSMARLWR